MTRRGQGIKRLPRTWFQEASEEVFRWLRAWESELDDRGDGRSADELVESLAVYAQRRRSERNRPTPLAA